MFQKILTTCLLIFICYNYSNGQLRLTKVDSVEMLQNIPYQGKLLAGYKWKDKNGINFLCITEKQNWKSGISKRITKIMWAPELNDSFPTTIYSPQKRGSISVKHTITKGHKLIPVWTSTDSVRFCEYSLTLQLLAKSVYLTDTNKNGIAEFWYGVHTDCSSDLSPAYYKLSMHEADKELIRSGRALIGSGNDKWGGNINRDDFKASPAEMLSFAQKLWEANLQQELR